MDTEDAGEKDSAPSTSQLTSQQRAEALARDAGVEDGEVSSLAAAQQRIHELRKGLAELEQQNEELRRTQEVLEVLQARYYGLYDMAPVGYLTISEDGLVLDANLTAATLLGVPRSALVKEPLSRSVLGLDMDIHALHRSRLWETGVPQSYELRMVRQGEPPSLFWTRLESILVRDAESGAPVCRVTMSDVTERKRAEETLRDREAKLRALLEVLPVGVSVLDRSRRIQLTNPALARILDLSQDQLRSGSYEERAYLRSDGTEMRPDEFPSNRAVREQRPIHGEEIGVVTGDGQEIWTGVSAAPLPFDDWNVIVTTADITRVKKAEMALQQAHSELEQRVRERTAELEILNKALQSEVAERQRAEQGLRASEERFRQLADHIDLVFFIADVATNQPLYISPAYEDLWGRPRQTLFERPSSFLEAIHEQDRARVEVALAGGSREEQEEQFRVIRPDGSLVWVRIRIFPVEDEQGRIYRLAGIAEDVSEQVEAVHLLEQRVEERTRQLSTLLQIASSMTLTLELAPLLDLILDGLQILVQYDGAIIYELQGEDLVAIAHRGLRPPETLRHSSIPVLESALAQKLIAEEGPLLLSDIQGQTGDRLLTPVSDWACCGMAAPLGVRQRVVGLLLLYSRRPQSYTRQQAALLLALANQAAVGVENARLYGQAQALAAIEERQRLARELHDAVSQTLFSANIIAEALPRIWDQNPEAVRRRLPQLHRLTSGALAEMRTLLLELRPTALVDVELSELLQQAVNAFAGRSRTRASLRLVGQRPLPVAVQLALYRIAQEALNNVAKHARAAVVEVRLHMEADRVELGIRDDGRGFDPDNVPPGCMGLTILQERANTIGATVEISSGLGDGTEIVVVWSETPLN